MQGEEAAERRQRTRPQLIFSGWITHSAPILDLELDVEK